MATKAAKMYAQRRKEIARLILRLEAKLRHHEKQAQKDPGDWGSAGDLGRISDGMRELVDSLTG